MSNTLTARHGGDGNPVAKSTVVAIDLVGSSAQTPLYTPAKTTPGTGDTGPSQSPLTYRIKVDAPAGVDDAYSQLFTPNSDYQWTWDNYIFPEAGTYTLRLLNGADDSVIAALNTVITVE